MNHRRPLALFAALTLSLAAGCASAPPPVSEVRAGGAGGPSAPTGVAPVASTALQFVRTDVDGEPLPVRAVIYPADRAGFDEPLGTLSGVDPATHALPPGRYRVLILAEPGPFGFEVELDPERPVCAEIRSRSRGHLVVVQTFVPGPPGLIVVERTTLGFGWGPIELEDVQRPPQPVRAYPLLDREI